MEENGKMATIKTVCDLLKSGDSPIKEVTIVGPIARLELKDGNVIEFARKQLGGIDWHVIRLNGKVVHQG